MTRASLHFGDCLDILPTMADASVDAVICDPPYPCINRPYGMWTEAAWAEMMHAVVRQCRRILKPKGSAVFVLQPNSHKAGSMRGWLWHFMAWACDEWNMVQDAYWWNIAAMPIGGATQRGLMRSSLKACVWLGPPDCYRDQGGVLWEESLCNAADRMTRRFVRRSTPSMRRSETESPRTHESRMATAALRRGGVTPYNVLPLANSNSSDSAGSHGHPAGTPLDLADFWVRYISPPGGVVLDPFMGSGTVCLAALKRGRSFIGIEKKPEYFEIASRRIEAATAELAIA